MDIEGKTRVSIDISWMEEFSKKYFQNKLRKFLKECWDEEIEHKLDFPDITVVFPEVGDRLEKLEDWKREIEQGWICINDCKCKGCTEMKLKLKHNVPMGGKQK